MKLSSPERRMTSVTVTDRICLLFPIICIQVSFGFFFILYLVSLYIGFLFSSTVHMGTHA